MIDLIKLCMYVCACVCSYLSLKETTATTLYSVVQKKTNLFKKKFFFKN